MNQLCGVKFLTHYVYKNFLLTGAVQVVVMFVSLHSQNYHTRSYEVLPALLTLGSTVFLREQSKNMTPPCTKT